MHIVTLKTKTMMKAPDINLDEYIPSAAPTPATASYIDDAEKDDEEKYEYVCINKEHLIARAMAGYWQVKAGFGIDDEEVMRLMDERYK